MTKHRFSKLSVCGQHKEIQAYAHSASDSCRPNERDWLCFSSLTQAMRYRRRPIEKKFPLRLDWRPPVKHLTRILSFLLFAAAMSCVTAQAQTCADWLKVKGWKGN
jgi:hypothetical protein